MTTEQKLQFIRNFIDAALLAEYRETKRYLLAQARGATLAYGADGSISVSDITSHIKEIDNLVKEIENGTV